MNYFWFDSVRRRSCVNFHRHKQILILIAILLISSDKYNGYQLTNICEKEILKHFVCFFFQAQKKKSLENWSAWNLLCTLHQNISNRKILLIPPFMLLPNLVLYGLPFILFFLNGRSF